MKENFLKFRTTKRLKYVVLRRHIAYLEKLTHKNQYQQIFQQIICKSRQKDQVTYKEKKNRLFFKIFDTFVRKHWTNKIKIRKERK